MCGWQIGCGMWASEQKERVQGIRQGASMAWKGVSCVLVRERVSEVKGELGEAFILRYTPEDIRGKPRMSMFQDGSEEDQACQLK